jgi:hypothetical protein
MALRLMVPAPACIILLVIISSFGITSFFFIEVRYLAFEFFFHHSKYFFFLSFLKQAEEYTTCFIYLETTFTMTSFYSTSIDTPRFKIILQVLSNVYFLLRLNVIY